MAVLHTSTYTTLDVVAQKAQNAQKAIRVLHEALDKLEPPLRKEAAKHYAEHHTALIESLSALLTKGAPKPPAKSVKAKKGAAK